MIVKQVDAKTRAKTSINELLRALTMRGTDAMSVAPQDLPTRSRRCASPDASPPSCWTTSRRTSRPASRPASSTASAHDYMVNVQGHDPGDAQLRAAGPHALPGVDLHLGQSRRLPRHSRRQEAEGRRHRQHRRHRDQGRLPRRHEPHVLSSATPRSRPSAWSRSPTRRCGGAFAPCKPGAHLGDIGATIQKYAEGNGFSVVREFCGHGIGRQFHEEPQVLHYGRPGTGSSCSPA